MITLHFLIGGSGTKQYLICLCQSSPLHFTTEGAFTNQWQTGGRLKKKKKIFIYFF